MCTFFQVMPGKVKGFRRTRLSYFHIQENCFFFLHRYTYLDHLVLKNFFKVLFSESKISLQSQIVHLCYTVLPSLNPCFPKKASYSFSPSSWTCSSSCCALCHRRRRRRREARGDVHREAAMVPQCGTARGIWWGWFPQSSGCGPRPRGARPCAALRGCYWEAGSTRSWLLWPNHSSDSHVTPPSHLQWAEVQNSDSNQCFNSLFKNLFYKNISNCAPFQPYNQTRALSSFVNVVV